MKAKHSAILLTGLLVAMIISTWAQTKDAAKPSCPPIEDEGVQMLTVPSGWVKADWNANTSRWDIDCSEFRSFAAPPNSNVNAAVKAVYRDLPDGPYMSNAVRNTNTRPWRDTNFNSNVPFKIANSANAVANAANAAANTAVNARKPATRRP